MFKKHVWTTATAGLLAILSPAMAENTMSPYSLYGVNGESGELVSYSFSNGEFDSVGNVWMTGIGNIYGIKGMAHLPKHMNIIGFWTNPEDGETKMVYINSKNAKATVVGSGLGLGHVTGATIAGLDEQGDLNEEIGAVSGDININPNNNPQSEFIVMNGTDPETSLPNVVLNRDMLHSGDYTSDNLAGSCTSIRIQPKGPGSQGTLLLNGNAVQIENNHSYTISCVESEGMSYSVVNTQSNGNSQAMGHWWLNVNGTGTITDELTSGVFVLQTIESGEEAVIDFENNGTSVTPTEPFAVKVSVLGAAISAGGAYDMPVTLKCNIGGNWAQPFGSYSSHNQGDVNDNNNPRRFIAPTIYPAGTNVSIKAQSWYSTNGTGNGNHESYLTVSTTTNSSNVIVLRHGDAVPELPAFLDQASITDLIVDYVENGIVVLNPNQAIYLFELGTTDLSTSYADFQDLVVLITFANDPSELNVNDDDDNVVGESSRLVKVNRWTGGYEQIMTLDREYDGLAAAPGGVFFATNGQQLFELDPLNQTETLVGTTAYSDITGLEAAGSTFCGFSSNAGVLTAVNVQTGQQIGSSVNIGSNDLQSIVFISHKLFSSNFD